MSPQIKRQDRSSPEYKRELYLSTAAVLILTITGGMWLGHKIARAEAARDSGEYEKVRKERTGKRPGIEQGIVY
jgi:hypothetical protein